MARRKFTPSLNLDGNEKSTVTKTGTEVTVNYCRKCMQTKDYTHFMTATDLFLDANGLMSVCKECINDIFDRFYAVDKDLDKTILRMCRMLNVRFDPKVVESTRISLEKAINNNKKVTAYFGLYKRFLLSNQKTEVGKRDLLEDFTFREPVQKVLSPEEASELGFNGSEDVMKFWGAGFNKDDYQFLENKYAEWSSSNRIDTQAEKSFVKLICIKELELQKAIMEGHNTSALIKDFRELINACGLSPNNQNAANVGKSQETWGNFIKQIEESEPAEVFADKELFRDYFEIDKYFKKYILRPLKNFVLGSRDFNVGENADSELDSYVDDDPAPELNFKPEEE